MLIKHDKPKYQYFSNKYIKSNITFFPSIYPRKMHFLTLWPIIFNDKVKQTKIQKPLDQEESYKNSKSMKYFKKSLKMHEASLLMKD